MVIVTYGRKLWRGLTGRNLAGLAGSGWGRFEEAQNRAALTLRGAAGSELLPE
jgi:hypothetical protein